MSIRSPTTPGIWVVLQALYEIAVIDANAEVVRIPADGLCPVCPDDERYRAVPGDSPETAAQKRRDAACKHRQAELDAVLLDPEACPECGAYRVEEYRHSPLLPPTPDPVSTYWCAKCDEFRGCKP